MAFVVFALSLVLILAGLWSGYASLDLLPTPLGVLYALAAAVAAAIAVLALALGVAIRRIDALAALMRQAAPLPVGEGAESEVTIVASSAHEFAAEALAGEILAGEAAILETAGEDVGAQETAAPHPQAEVVGAPEETAEHPINERSPGHLPRLSEVEVEPEPNALPALVGRYCAGGASYMIFSDGSIEAETADGTFKFPSMGDFKRFIAESNERHA
jgi:hypothetical protein